MLSLYILGKLVGWAHGLKLLFNPIDCPCQTSLIFFKPLINCLRLNLEQNKWF